MMSEEASDEIPDLMMRLMRQFGIAKSRVSALHREDAVPLYLLAKIGEGPPRRAGTLAAELDADPSTVSRQVAQLVKDGMVERKADPEDGRASILELTDAGRRRRAEMFRHRATVFGAVTQDWTDGERAEFGRLLHRYVEQFEADREDLLADALGARFVTLHPSEQKDSVTGEGQS
ncbi:MarR family winged helix-turn-helix transcriptional regulator [Nakamurella lactea]|uniref:MarR family winged helix-turn-helix transcriptional regulator n=1 Tax=Nakamurella lactea TaxID=459515 RepID=UPI0003F4F38B|nr:MarR family transcriptional regulator [Nakamurella lactea]